MDRVGVLALQGDYELHQRMLARVGCESRQVRKAAELEGLAALVLPGGESTTMLKFIEEEGLMEPLRRFYAERSGSLWDLRGSHPARERGDVADPGVTRSHGRDRGAERVRSAGG